MQELLRNEALGKLILRLSVGLLLLFHGVSKVVDPGPLGFIETQLVTAGLPAVLSWGVYIGEVIAPLMIVLGISSRIGALLAVVNMLFAVFLVHSGDFLALTDHGGWRLELQGLYLFGSLAIVFLGSGRIAIRPD